LKIKKRKLDENNSEKKNIPANRSEEMSQKDKAKNKSESCRSAGFPARTYFAQLLISCGTPLRK
jgi:hypothetical protein